MMSDSFRLSIRHLFSSQNWYVPKNILSVFILSGLGGCLQFLICHPEWRWTEFQYNLIKFSTDLCPSRSHSCGEIIHLNPCRINTLFKKNMLKMFNFGSCMYISFQEMTLPFQSSCNKHPVYPPYHGSKHIIVIKFARAGQPYDYNIMRI